MWKQRLMLIVLTGLLVGMGCSNPSDDSVALEVDFRWNAPCTSLFKTPEIKVGNIPPGTRRFYVGLIDLNLPAFDHGGGFAPYTGADVIPAGAVEGSYKGPSPPHGVIHHYEITVEALDDKDRRLGVGKQKRRYPPEGEEEIRWKVCE